jgi:hypothetical protein
MLRRFQCSHLILLLMAAITSQPSLAQPDYEETPPSEYVARIVTPVDRVRVTIIKPRARIHLAKTHQPVARLFLNEDDTDYYDETPDLQIGYRRPELVNQTGQVHDDLSDEVKLRLLLARKRALEAYYRTWG